MTDQALDKLMRRILLDSLRKDEAELEEQTEPFFPSRGYQRQIKKMLTDPIKWFNSKTKPSWKRVAQKVAVVALIISIGLGSLMALSPTVRASIIRWVTELYETHIVYRYSGEDISGEMPKYVISALPEGFFENAAQRIENPGYTGIWYENQEGKVILLDYMYMQQGSASSYVTEDVTVFPVKVNGWDGKLIKSKNSNILDSTLIWIDVKANMQFSVNAALNEMELLHMGESVILVNSTK
jgi:hypothetical protein